MRRHLFIGITVLIFVFFGVVSGGGVYYVSRTRPGFCRSCHLMEAAYQSWQKGEHQKIPCQVCHKAPLSRKLKGVWRWATERPGTFPSDVNFHFNEDFCLSCHQKEDANWPVLIQSKDHALHPNGEKIMCMNCHHAGQHHYSAMNGPARCTECHGSGAREDLAYCEGCHKASVQIIEADVSMDLPRATSEHIGVACIQCHLPDHGASAPYHSFVPILEDEKNVAMQGCLKCHEDYSREELLRFIITPRNKTEERLRHIKEMKRDLDVQRGGNILQNVDRVVRLIEEDRSRGFHNEVFTFFMLEKAEEDLKRYKKGDNL